MHDFESFNQETITRRFQRLKTRKNVTVLGHSCKIDNLAVYSLHYFCQYTFLALVFS
jgi:hypothetical protein